MTTDTTTEAVTAIAEDMQEHMPWGRGSITVRALLAERDALAAQLAAAEARARESALDALAAYGQAAEAHEAQLAAEQRLATARGDALEEAARVCDEMHNDWRRTDVQDAAAAIRALAKGGE